MVSMARVEFERRVQRARRARRMQRATMRLHPLPTAYHIPANPRPTNSTPGLCTTYYNNKSSYQSTIYVATLLPCSIATARNRNSSLLPWYNPRHDSQTKGTRVKRMVMIIPMLMKIAAQNWERNYTCEPDSDDDGCDDDDGNVRSL